jgi:uncharacterized protein (TIGR02145 family)
MPIALFVRFHSKKKRWCKTNESYKTTKIKFMKNNYLTLVSLILLLSTFGVKAQQTISLAFNSTANLDSVKIENLNNTSSKLLKGSYNIVLQLDAPNLIESIEMFSEPIVYPNPFTQQVNFEFLSTFQNKVNLAVYDLSGKVVAQLNQSIDLGSHRFTFRPSRPGVYLMKVSDKSKVYNAKIICTEGNSSHPIIEYTGLVSTQTTKPSQVKSKVTNSLADLTAKSGDMLRFTGYSSSKINSIYDLAYSSKNYAFTFGDRYFNFKNYNIQSSKPSFVDIMFSVTDINQKGVDYLSNSDFSVLEDNATTSLTETFRYIRKMQQIPSKLKTVLLLDNSTSVSADIETIKSAAIKFVNSIREGQEIAIYVFSDSPVLLQNFTTNKNLLETAIKSISLGFPSTNLYGSTINGLSQWNDTYTLSSITQGSLIIFTDGSDTQGSSTLSNVIASRGDKKVYVIGLGSEINPTALNQIANPGPYYPIQKASELDAVFATIQSDIVQFSNSFYWLNYMSPKRTGIHTLKVSATNNTNTTSTSYLTGSFSATGFSSVLSGVYVNKEDTRLYGLDTIRCFSSSVGYTFAYDINGINQYSKDSLILKPVTYWAIKPPIYTWNNSKSAVYSLKASSYSTSTLFPTKTSSDTATITLKDEANGYTKNVVLIICPDFAELNTAAPKSITATTATLGGEVKNIGRTAVTERGMCWNTTTSPTIINNKLAVGSGKGVFESTVSGLAKGTKYYARAYATNTAGTAYGNETSFTTLANIPTLSTSIVSSITQTTAICGGTISSNEGATVTARGVCWSTNKNPTILDSKTTNGIGIGTFTSSITGLNPETIYCVRAYATNSEGTAYGEEFSFSTKLPTLSTTAVSTITATTATCGGNVTNVGGATVTARGVCWSTSTGPTINNSKTIDSSGSGIFTSSITGLTIGTTYYVRSYATNSIGTVYGNEIIFSTNLPTVTTNDISAITTTTATCGGNVTDSGGSAVTARGISYTSTTTTYTTRITNGPGIGTFTSAITGLTVGTTYYVQAFATNSIGTTYGNKVSFATSLPIVTTSAVSNITPSTATCGGNVTAIGGTTITARGVCWSTTINPTIANSKTTDGNGNGVFTSLITGLTIGSTYYVRAYATDSAGTTYGAEISFLANETVTDIDGNLYNTVTIGTQTWMVENLKTTHYRDGSLIANVTDNTAWTALSTGAWCDYSNSSANGIKYGHLYNWYAASDSHSIAPVGWHVPTDAEWTTLTTYLGGESVAGGKLKETGTLNWTSPNTGATNETDFSALPGGISNTDLGIGGYWWSSSQANATMAWSRYVHYYYSKVYTSFYSKSNRLSVRCLRD